jgi:hypothetical protein
MKQTKNDPNEKNEKCIYIKTVIFVKLDGDL